MARASESIANLNRTLLGLIQLKREQERLEADRSLRREQFDLNRRLKEAGLAELQRKRKLREDYASQLPPGLRAGYLAGLDPKESALYEVLTPPSHPEMLPENVLGPQTKPVADLFKRRAMLKQVLGIRDPEEEARRAIELERAKTPIIVEREKEKLTAEAALEEEKQKKLIESRRALIDPLVKQKLVTPREAFRYISKGELSEQKVPTTLKGLLAQQLVESGADQEEIIETINRLEEKGLTPKALLDALVRLRAAQLRGIDPLTALGLQSLSGGPAVGVPRSETRTDPVQELRGILESLVPLMEQFGGAGKHPTTPKQPKGRGAQPTLPVPTFPVTSGTSEAGGRGPVGKSSATRTPRPQLKLEPQLPTTTGTKSAPPKTGAQPAPPPPSADVAIATVKALEAQGLSKEEARKLFVESDLFQSLSPEQKRAVMQGIR